MKKLLLITALLLGAAGMRAQSKATAVVTLGTGGMTAKMDLNNATTTATLTLTGPSDRWFALQIGNFTNGGGMQEGADVVYWNGTTLIDAVHQGIGSPPAPDTNDWTVTSNAIAGTTRTVVATRAFNTGSTDDYTIVYGNTDIDFAWARASTATNTLISHGTTRGYSLNNTFSCVAPSAPTASAQTFCAGATVTSLVATGQAGATFKWYAAATGGATLPASTVLTNGTTYYASQLVGDCESTTRASATVTITTVPKPTTTNAAQQFCSPTTIAGLQVSGQTGATFNWYNVANGGNTLPTTTALTAGNYYVSQTVGSCTSERLLIAVSFNTIPTPTASEAQSFCSESTVANLVATGQAGATLSWYNEPTGGTLYASTTVLVAGNYYVSQTVGSCVSARKKVVVSYTTLAAPAASEAQSFCSESTVANLTATGLAGSTLSWYNVATGGDALVSTTVLVAGNYYVSQTVGSCVSTRKMVVVSYTTLAAPAANEAQSFCSQSTVANLTATGLAGSTLKWYNVATGGDALAGTTVLVAGNYYVSQTVGSCVSSRKMVVVSYTTLAAPNVPSEIPTVCPGTTIANLAVTGLPNAIFRWYATATGGTVIPPTTALIDGNSYYVSQTVGDCVSNRRMITVNIDELPAPVGEHNQSFCSGATISDLTVTGVAGGVISWHKPQGTPALGSNTLLVSGVYYAVQTLNGCTSPVKEVVVALLPAPAAPSGAATQQFEEGDTVADFTIGIVVGNTVQWYIMVEEELVEIEPTTLAEDGVVYYVTQTAGDCESAPLAITANKVLGLPAHSLKNIMVYPNPVVDRLVISNNETITEVLIVNMLGQTVVSQKTNSSEVEVTTSQLQNGSYILKVTTAYGTASFKIVK